jgi:branched-chain amino acid transport system permease protein
VVRELLVDYPTYAQVAYGSIVVLIVVFFPAGLAGLPGQLRRALHPLGWLREKATAPSLRAFQPYEPATPRPDPTPVLLDIRTLSMNFRGLKALRDVSLTVVEGEIRGIVGPNGSGKTTLFNVVSGLYRPTSGEVFIGGRRSTGARAYAVAQAGVARTFQNLRLFRALTVRDNILVALDRSRIWASWRYALWQLGVWRYDQRLRADADAVLERFGLADFAGSLPGALPYGTQRRVEMARAMARRPRLLLLDEPAAGLNGEEVRQLGDIVRSIRSSGVTVVIIEHNMSLVMSLCDRITVLSSGAIIAEGLPAEVAVAPQVIEAYLGDSAMSADVPDAIATEVTR